MMCTDKCQNVKNMLRRSERDFYSFCLFILHPYAISVTIHRWISCRATDGTSYMDAKAAACIPFLATVWLQKGAVQRCWGCAGVGQAGGARGVVTQWVPSQHCLAPDATGHHHTTTNWFYLMVYLLLGQITGFAFHLFPAIK